MKTLHDTNFSKDVANNKITVVRSFDAPVDLVWKAWTEHELLDQWWAPKPWKAITKTQDFREGGHWLYCMQGPDGSKAWCRVNYRTITPKSRFTGDDAFVDENEKVLADFPSMNWDTKFSSQNSGTTVHVNISFASEADMKKIIEMGFQEGFTSALRNLDDLLECSAS